jgi:hypothetical protein
MLFISVRSSAPEHVPKVLQVVEDTKRVRHKAGEEAELYQYVVYEASPLAKGPRRINLDDAKSKGREKYEPPTSLTVHLSKISMPELQPKGSQSDSGRAAAKESTRDKDRGKQTKTEAKLSKRPSPSSTPGHSRMQSYQSRPDPPAPSPAQLNNPGLYVASPLASSRAHPHHAPPERITPSPSQLNNPGLFVASPPPHRAHSPYTDPYSRSSRPHSSNGGGSTAPNGPPGALNSSSSPSSSNMASASSADRRHPSATALVTGWLDKTKNILQSQRPS